MPLKRALTIGGRRVTTINVDTRAGNPIENVQEKEVSSSYSRQWKKLEEKYKDKVDFRSSISGIYNCFGLVFASRRTNIDKDIDEIIEDDDYREVGLSQVRAGDIVLYRNPDSKSVEHAGIVVEVKRDKITIVNVVSKWGPGREAVHPVRLCPYQETEIEYYRIEV